MPPENKGAFQSHDIVAQFGVMQDGGLKDLYFHSSLHCEFLLVLYDLQRNVLFFLMVVSLKNLTK